MMKQSFLTMLLAAGTFLATLSAAEKPAQGVPMRLWSGDAPEAKGQQDYDIPKITPYLPEGTSSAPIAAVVICPGGGYRGLAANHEGKTYAQFLNRKGIAAFVLQYRLGADDKGKYRYPVMNLDASRAIRLVRANAAKWNLDPARIGIMGSSAGGHLAAMTAVKFDAGQPGGDAVDQVSSRPDFAILCYAQTSMNKEYGPCCGSKKALLDGTSYSEDDVAAYRFVNKQTPPFFIWHTFSDPGVPVKNALDMANALNRFRVPYDLHIYKNGGHGLGMGSKAKPEDQFKMAHPWTQALDFWLSQNRISASK